MLCVVSRTRLVQPLFNGGGGPLPLLMVRIAELGAANAVCPMVSAPPNIRPITKRADATNVTVAEATFIASLKPKEMLGLHRRSSQRL